METEPKNVDSNAARTTLQFSRYGIFITANHISDYLHGFPSARRVAIFTIDKPPY